MSDEKKLPDEALKDVSGGLKQEEWERYSLFNARNCAICTAGRRCFYQTTFEAFDKMGGVDCPDFVGDRKANRF